MNYRKRILICVVFSLILWGLVYLLGFLLMKNNCGTNDLCPANFISFQIIQPLFFLLPFFAGIFVFLLLFSEKVFTVWKKFALVAIPLMVLIIIITPTECRSLFCFDKGRAAILIGILYAILSVLIIVISAIIFKIENKKHS